jgi:hypothetical protein
MNEQLAKEVGDVAKMLSTPIDTVAVGINRSVWIGLRTDGNKGSGTQHDPFDGSTPEKFDALFRSLPSHTRINILPGVYLSHGTGEGTGPLCFKPGWQLHGCGMASTIIRLIPASFRINRKNAWLGPPLDYGMADDVEVADLTVDCAFNLAQAPAGTCVSGIFNIGARIAFRRLEVINFGSNWQESFPLVIGVGRNHYGSDFLIEGCRLHKFAGVKIGADGGCCSMVGIFGTLTAPEMLSPEEGVTYGYTNLISHGIGAVIRNNYLDGSLPDGSIGNCTGIVAPTSMPTVLEGNTIINCEVGGPWQDSEPIMDVIARNNRFWNCRYGSYIARGYRANAPSYKTRQVILENNDYYLAKTPFTHLDWPLEYPIGIRLYGDHPNYSWMPLPKTPFYTTEYARIANNRIGFVSNRFQIWPWGQIKSPDSLPLPYTVPPRDPQGWDAPVHKAIVAMMFSRVEHLEVIHNSISAEFLNPAFTSVRPIRVRGSKTIYAHGNRYTNGKACGVSFYRPDDGINGKFDRVPLDVDYLGTSPTQT